MKKPFVVIVMFFLFMVICPRAHAFYISDNYIGSNDHGYGDVIGDPIFDISGMDVTYTNGFMDVTIYTPFQPLGSGSPTYGETYGDLFISTNGWHPDGLAASGYLTDNYSNGEHWEFVFDTSAGLLYSLPDYDSNTIVDYITLAKSGSGLIVRDGQEVLYKAGGTDVTNGSTVDLSNAGTSISYSIALASLGDIDGGVIGLKWGATCANDDIEGGVPHDSVPEPATMLLLGTSLVGLIGFGRKKFRKS